MPSFPQSKAPQSNQQQHQKKQSKEKSACLSPRYISPDHKACLLVLDHPWSRWKQNSCVGAVALETKMHTNNNRNSNKPNIFSTKAHEQILYTWTHGGSDCHLLAQAMLLDHNHRENCCVERQHNSEFIMGDGHPMRTQQPSQESQLSHRYRWMSFSNICEWRVDEDGWELAKWQQDGTIRWT